MRRWPTPTSSVIWGRSQGSITSSASPSTRASPRIGSASSCTPSRRRSPTARACRGSPSRPPIRRRSIRPAKSGSSTGFRGGTTAAVSSLAPMGCCTSPPATPATPPLLMRLVRGSRSRISSHPSSGSMSIIRPGRLPQARRPAPTQSPPTIRSSTSRGRGGRCGPTVCGIRGGCRSTGRGGCGSLTWGGNCGR